MNRRCVRFRCPQLKTDMSANETEIALAELEFGNVGPWLSEFLDRTSRSGKGVQPLAVLLMSAALQMEGARHN